MIPTIPAVALPLALLVALAMIAVRRAVAIAVTAAVVAIALAFVIVKSVWGNTSISCQYNYHSAPHL